MPIDGTPSKSDPISSETSRQRNALRAERVLPGALHGGEEGDAIGYHPHPADEFQRAGVDGHVDRTGHRDRDVLRIGDEFEFGVLEHDAVGDRDVADAGGERQVAELRTDVRLDVQVALAEELVGAQPGQVEPAVDQQAVCHPGAGDRLQFVEGEGGVVEGGDDDQRIGQVHAVQPAERRRQRGEPVVVVQFDAEREAPGRALANDRLYPLEAGAGGREATPRTAPRRCSAARSVRVSASNSGGSASEPTAVAPQRSCSIANGAKDGTVAVRVSPPGTA